MKSGCYWCGQLFSPRRTGGSPQIFCHANCRHEFHTRARKWIENEIAEGRMGAEELKISNPNKAFTPHLDSAKGPKADSSPTNTHKPSD